MSTLRVVHYLNQFFAGIGSEAQADLPPGKKEGAVGPGIALQRALGDKGTVVATIYCGDNYAAVQANATDEILALIKQEQPDIVIAGPAFGAGRYGIACGQICLAVKETLGITAVTGMHIDNAGADLYHSKVYIASTRNTAAGMAEAINAMTKLALKLHAGETLGSPQEDGYLPTGRRVHFFAEKNAAERAVEMLLNKVNGQAYKTEWAVPVYNHVEPAPPLEDLSNARIAIVTTGGLVPHGNPDRLESAYATKWLKYSLKETQELSPDQWESIHGGFDTSNVNEDPDRVVPIDALRALEREGVFGSMTENVYTTTGNTSAIPTMRKFAQEMLQEFKADNVDGVIITSTWGSCSRGGAAIAKEFEAAGLPVAYITTLDTLGQSVGANRIVRGRAITNVVGDPELRPEEEFNLRRDIVKTALEALKTPVEGPTILG